MSSPTSGETIFRCQAGKVGLDAKVFYTAYLAQGGCHAIPDPAEYAYFLHRVADVLSCKPEGGVELVPDEVVIVGSGKLGYSLSKAKDFKKFDVLSGSDLDVAVVSERLFEVSLEDIRAMKMYYELNRGLVGKRVTQEVYDKIYLLRSVLDGFVPLDRVLPRMRYGARWSKARDAMAESLGGDLTSAHINFRLYKSRDHLRDYQMRSVDKAINSIRGTAGVHI